MIREDVAHFLKNPESGTTTDTDRQAARRNVADWIKKISAGRRPANTGHEYQITLRLIRGRHFHDLQGDGFVRVVIWGKGIEAATRVPRIAKEVRLALADYRGLMNATTIHGVTIEVESDSPPLNPMVADEWTHTYYFDFKIVYDQEVTNV